MEIEDIVSRLDAIEERISSLSTSFLALKAEVGEVDQRANNFLVMVRDQNKEISRLNSTIMNLGKFDGAINQVRTDFNRKIDEIENQRKQQEQIRANITGNDIKNVQSQFDLVKKEIKADYEQRLTVFVEENTRLVKRFEEIQERNRENIISSEELKASISTMQQDVRRATKQIDGLLADQAVYRDAQNDIRSKFESITDALRTNETRLNELVATESERRQNQIDFMQQQSVVIGDRERVWSEWSQEFEQTVKQVQTFLPDLQKQQFSLKNTKEEMENVTKQFERRIKEITEMYRLMDERFKKEWNTFKADAEKRWSNISLVLDDKQGGYTEKFSDLQKRILLVEDNNQEMQEVLLLMSSEIQKGMQSIMKMVNGWMEAFSHIKTSS